jgi:hypothetical protein
MSTLFIGTCVNLPAEKLEEFDDSARTITYRTFAKHIGREGVLEINGWAGVPIHKDWHVSFERGKWDSKPAVCLHHSVIHHIWTI